MRMIVRLTSLLHLLLTLEQVLAIQICIPQPSCRECIKSPGCAWCTKTGFLQMEESSERRCDTAEGLTRRHCDSDNQLNPDSEPQILKNKELSNSSEKVVQLKPQNIHIPLRVGVPQTFNVSFKRAEGYPIDLYYLMDLSFSMADDLDTIKKLSQDIVNTLQGFTRNMRIGFGAFVDKMAWPYVSQTRKKKIHPCPYRHVSCQPAFSYRNILSLTEDAADFKREVSRQRISANLDSPEAGFDAIMQAAVCKDLIGWKNVTKILIYTSDDTFHIAGDGRLAGIYTPHDGQCHLNQSGFYDGTKFDYPSIGHLARVLKANNIQLIFAVTKNISAAYEELSKMIPQSVVGVLESDSSNVVQLIKNAYNSLSSNILLEHLGAPQGLAVSYQAHCAPGEDPTPWSSRGECKDIKITQQVNFTVRLNISECLKEKTEILLSVQGISDKLTVTVETQCECDCGPDVPSSTDCSGNGTLSCSVCSCDPGFLGQRCECEQGKDEELLESKCRQDNSSQLCNGHGSCVCGMCLCQRSFKGRHCECDDSNCEQNNQKLCSGNGYCSCGVCECFNGYKGVACDCSTDITQCGMNASCSGQGECLCNKCKCNEGFIGINCSTILNACEKYSECVTCASEKAEETADLTTRCLRQCDSDIKWERHDVLKDAPCATQTLMYDVKLSPDGTIVLHFAYVPQSIDKTWVIIGTSVSGIILIGVALILTIRLLMDLKYRKEYRSFIKAQNETVWTEETKNPLFKRATTTTINPLHTHDE